MNVDHNPRPPSLTHNVLSWPVNLINLVVATPYNLSWLACAVVWR